MIFLIGKTTIKELKTKIKIKNTTKNLKTTKKIISKSPAMKQKKIFASHHQHTQNLSRSRVIISLS
jgi:hypothetical protein